MERIIHHTIPDLYQTLNLPFTGAMDFAILSVPAIHEQIPFNSPKLRADYFSFILTKSGAGVYYLDDNRFPFGSQSIYFTNPGHLKSYELLASKEAFIITLTERFLREHVQPNIYEAFPFLLAEKVPPQELPTEDFENIASLYQQIWTEFYGDSRFKSKILGNLMMILLLKIKEKFWADYNPLEEGSRDSQIVRSFKQLIEAEFKRILRNDHREVNRQVQYFAKQLNLHPNYLNSVIKSKTGRTVNDWISERTLSVAKSLLLDTSASAKEIAYQLGFSEPTHFSRFFKKHTQQSPSAFRKAERL
ncbi:MAG: helix-turn-helix transcriptional regulator [Bacteroidota bacterium]